MRLTCSPYLSEEDVVAIERGLELRERIDATLLRDIGALLSTPFSRLGVELLATMLAAGVLDLRIAYRAGSAGVFHSKVGIFRSADGAKLAFIGSANETGAAVLQERNHESFVVFRSWGGEVDAARVTELADYLTRCGVGKSRTSKCGSFQTFPANSWSLSGTGRALSPPGHA